jgi:myo-inositol 2-dehydrogenase / D-chiro-inositol 1-dehydrogenase
VSEHTSGLTVGVLGVGRIGRMHAAHLAMHPGVSSVILLGRDQARLKESLPEIVSMGAESPEWMGREHKLASKLHPRALPPGAKDPAPYQGIEGLVIAASTDSHRTLVTQTAGLGIPLMIEKPLAPTVEEQIDLIQTMQDSGVSCMMGYHRRYDDDHRRLRRQVKSGALGSPRGAVAVSLDYSDAEESYVPSSGGLWRDLAIHDFNALAWILNDRVVSVSAHSAVLENPMYRRYDDVDTASATLTFSSGLMATILCGRHMGWRQEARLEVHGTAGSDSTADVSRGSRTHILDGDSEVRTSFTSSIARFKQAYLNEADEFVQLVRGSAEVSSPPSECLAALQVALAAEKSSKTGKSVRVV